jgi:hypothetical protein
MEWNKTLAIISIAGFAVQRALEILDPLFIGVVFKWKERRSGKLPFDLTDTAAKAALMTFVAFLISLPIAYFSPVKILEQIASDGALGLNTILGALAISAGSNGFNSLLKFGEHAKEMRKVEVRPLPEVKVKPLAATIKANSSIKLRASVSGSDNKDVTWEVLEAPGGTVTADGVYTAPGTPGTYHVAAISKDNSAATELATLTVG